MKRACADKTFEFKKLFMLDPLLITGWAHHGDHLCDACGRSHPEIARDQICILSACMIEGHWIPVVLAPNGNQLSFTTWDAPQHSHDVLDKVVEAISKSLGFDNVVRLRHQRMFFTSNKCGALAMAYLHHWVLGSMLPTNNEEAEVIMRVFAQHSSRQFMDVSWPEDLGSGALVMLTRIGFTMNQASSTDRGAPDAPAQNPHATSFSHQCIPREDRMTMLRDKGKMWGDDEIRFHLTHMINHSSNVSNLPYAHVPGFVMLDPLLLCTWDSIGKDLCTAWCRRHQVVSEQGFHVVAVLLQDDHWFPAWFVPHGRTLVAHLIDDGVIEPAVIQPM